MRMDDVILQICLSGEAPLACSHWALILNLTFRMPKIIVFIESSLRHEFRSAFLAIEIVAQYA